MIDKFVKYYSSVQNKNKIFASLRLYSLLRFCIRFIANIVLPVYFFFTRSRIRYSLISIHKAKRVIVSLTSFPARINRLWLVIESLLRQTQKPDRIILYLSSVQFPNENSLPKLLLKQKKRGLEIRFVDGDYRSHKKYLYSLTDFPEDILLTIDDDIFYRSTMIENLYNTSLLYPSTVIAHYCKQIVWNEDQELMQYNTWPLLEEEKEAGLDVFFGSGGGVLFPPHTLHSDVFNMELFNSLCPTADDIWLYVMCRLNNTKIKNIPGTSVFLPVLNWNNANLFSANNGLNQNDIQIQNTRNYYQKSDPFKRPSN